MNDRPSITLPPDFELFRDASFESRLPREHVGFYLAAKKYAALKNSDGSYVGTFDGAPVNDEFAFDLILAPMGPSISVSGGGYWSEDIHGSIFNSNAQLTSLDPEVVRFSLNNMSNESIIADIDGIRSGSPGFSYGSYIPDNVLNRIEEWISKSDSYKNELRSRLDSESGEQISQTAKNLYESAASYRSAAAELFSFAKLRSKQLAYKNIQCGPRETLDFGSGRCVLSRANIDPRTSLSSNYSSAGSSSTWGDGPFVGGSSSAGSGSASSSAGSGSGSASSSAGSGSGSGEANGQSGTAHVKKNKSKKKSGGSGLLIAGAAVLGLLAFGGKK